MRVLGYYFYDHRKCIVTTKALFGMLKTKCGHEAWKFAWMLSGIGDTRMFEYEDDLCWDIREMSCGFDILIYIIEATEPMMEVDVIFWHCRIFFLVICRPGTKWLIVTLDLCLLR